MSKHLSVDVASVYFGPPTTLATVLAGWFTAVLAAEHSTTLTWTCVVSLHVAVVVLAVPQCTASPVVAAEMRTALVPRAPHVAAVMVPSDAADAQHT